MSRTDKDRPWDVRLSDMTTNLDREIFHRHSVFDSTTNQWVRVECDFDPRNNLINFQAGYRYWKRDRPRHCTWMYVVGQFQIDKCRKDDRKAIQRQKRQRLRKQLNDARREGIDTDPDIV